MAGGILVALSAPAGVLKAIMTTPRLASIVVMSCIADIASSVNL
jgi:hypothetical protein